jgi:hypothetical protein
LGRSATEKKNQWILYSLDVKERTIAFMYLSVSYQMMARKYAETCRIEYSMTKSCCFLKLCCPEHMARVVHVFVLMMLYKLHILRVI